MINMTYDFKPLGQRSFDAEMNTRRVNRAASIFGTNAADYVIGIIIAPDIPKGVVQTK